MLSYARVQFSCWCKVITFDYSLEDYCTTCDIYTRSMNVVVILNIFCKKIGCLAKHLPRKIMTWQNVAPFLKCLQNHVLLIAFILSKYV